MLSEMFIIVSCRKKIPWLKVWLYRIRLLKLWDWVVQITTHTKKTIWSYFWHNYYDIYTSLDLTRLRGNWTDSIPPFDFWIYQSKNVIFWSSFRGNLLSNSLRNFRNASKIINAHGKFQNCVLRKNVINTFFKSWGGIDPFLGVGWSLIRDRFSIPKPHIISTYFKHYRNIWQLIQMF